jgi:hypothetical protein
MEGRLRPAQTTRTSISPTPSTPPVMTSPRWTAPTPAGVPVDPPRVERDPFFEGRPASSGSDHPHLDLAHALDASRHDVAALDRADARGRAR